MILASHAKSPTILQVLSLLFVQLFDETLKQCPRPGVAQDADDAMSESSWTALAKEKERYWWTWKVKWRRLEVVGLLV